MAKVELGFSGERFIYLPIPMINLMEDSPLTGDLYLYSMGYFSRASHHYINRPTGCDEFLFIYCKEGCGWIELYGKRQNLEANQFIILPRNIPHAYGADETSPWTIYWIHFRGSKAPLFSSRFDKPTTVSHSAQSRIEERLDLFEEIFFTLNESTSMDHMHYANLCFAHFLGSFLFIDVYRNNFRSESYFYRKFVKETGHSPMDYFTRLKINKACKLLIQTDMKVNQIAHKLGFKESQYFSRTFSNVMGLSPMEFRRQNFRL